MNFNKILRYGEKTAKVFLIGNIIYFGGFIVGVNGIHRAFSPKIRNQSELELRLKEERKKLQIGDHIKINAYLSKSGDSYAKKLGPNEYEIKLEPLLGQNLDVLRHELYHIADGHCDYFEKMPNNFINGLKHLGKYLYWDEPQAILYSIAGLEL